MAQKINLPALRVHQKHGDGMYDLFITRIKTKDLIDETQFKVDYWDHEKSGSEQGYQRRPTDARKRQIANFVSEQVGMFPSSILISSRKPLEYDEDKQSLVLNEYPLWIIDGQHRVEGLRYAIDEMGEALDDFELPVCVLVNPGKFEEVNQFHALNSKQKRVPTDLSQRLMLELTQSNESYREMLKKDRGLWEVRALAVVIKLNEREGNPWHGRIKQPNTKKLPFNIVNQTSLVTSLKPLFKEGYCSSRLDVDRNYELLKNYWLAIADIFPDCFVDPKNYVIQKTPGVFSLHSLLHKILLKGVLSTHTRAEFTKVLKQTFKDTDKYDSDFWRKDGDEAALAGSMKGFAILADEFNENLESEIQ